MDSITRPVGVIGHKNPDSDSICSAIAYAALKNRLGVSCTPLRAGELNNETRYLLEHFGVEAPTYCPDVRAEVMDIDIRQVKGVPADTPLRKAWETMRDQNITTLPITGSAGELAGLITLTDIALANMDHQGSCFLAESRTPYRCILSTLEGTLLCGDPDGCVERGKIVIGAASPEIIEDVVEPGDLVLVANRYESQYCAIMAGAGCIIACTGAAVPDSILQLAKAHNCTVISTPCDTYPAACQMIQCVPVRHYMLPREQILYFHTTDEVEDVRTVMGKYRHIYFPVLDTEGHYVGVISRRNLLNLHRKQLILVDHNEKTHCVDGYEEAEILEIIDHHRIGNLETGGPIYFRNQPVGCTATIVYTMYREYELEPEPPIAGLLLGAILSDTLNLHSPTCTPTDVRAAEALSAIAGECIDELAQHMFEAGEALTGKTAEVLMQQDFKTFSGSGVTFGVGAGGFLSERNYQLAEEMISGFLQAQPKAFGTDMNYFMLTSLRDCSTRLLCSSSEALQLAERAFGKSPEPGKTYLDLPDVVSRKKQLIPPLLQALAEEA